MSLRLRGVDGLRGLAALTVFLHHSWLFQYREAFPGDHGLIAATFRELRLGLICFFVLSGYLLFGRFVRGQLAGEQPEIKSYLIRRAGRILPAYYLALIGAVALFHNAPEMIGFRANNFAWLPLHIFFLQDYSIQTLQRLNPVTWTLGIEMAFYLLLPVIAIALSRVRASARALFLTPLFCIIIGPLYNLVSAHLQAGPVASFSLLSYLPYFGVGMFIAYLMERAHQQRYHLKLGVKTTAIWMLVGLALVIANGAWEHLTHWQPASFTLTDASAGRWWWEHCFRDLPAAVGFCAIMTATLIGTGPAVGWTRWRWLVGLGTVSYSFYLWHLMIINFLRWHHLAHNFLAMVVIGGPISLAIAVISWRWIEQPVIDWVHRRKRREEPKAPTFPALGMEV